MKNTRILAVALLIAATALRSGAADPAPTGKVMLLTSDRLLEGDIERLGDCYRVRRGDGEVTVPVEKVAFVGEDGKQVYAFLKGRSDDTKAEDHLKLARWCFNQKLRDDAIAEAEIATKLAPNLKAASDFLRQLRHADAAPSHDEPPTSLPQTASIEPTNCSPEALRQFNTKVQPILNNACITCHSSATNGGFQLQRTSTAANLAACLKQIDRANPMQSPLLVKAIAAHGGSDRAPIKDAQAAPYKHLESWVKQIAGDGPARNPSTLKAVSRQVGGQPEVVSKPTGDSKEPPPPKDPFDPEIFNRMTRPGK